MPPHLPEVLVTLRRAVLLAALLVASWTTAARAQSEGLPDELQTIASVRLEGTKHVHKRALWSANLKTRRPSRLPWHEKPPLRLDFLRADTAAIASLYRHYGYLDARAHWRLSASKDSNAVHVVFVIEEGERSLVQEVQLDGVHVYPENQLRKSLFAQPRKPFDPAYLQLDTLKISELYQERGYLPHTVAGAQRGVPESLQVHVRYDLHEGALFHVGEVSYLSSSPDAHPVRESLGRRELLLKPGEVYRRSRVIRSVERLYQTGLFSQVQVTPMPDSTNSAMNFLLRVRDRKPRWVDAGVGSGTSERFRFTGEWGHNNLDTRALRAVIGSRLAFDGNGKFLLTRTESSLLEPWLFGVRLSGLASVFYQKTDDRSDPRFLVREEGSGFGFTLARELSRISRVSLLQENTFERQTYDLLALDVPDSTRDSVAASVVPRFRTNRLVLTLERDLRDNRIAPVRGSYQSINLELAGGPLKGTSSFRKGVFYSAWYSPQNNGWQLAARILGGSIAPFGDTALFSPDREVDRQVARVPLGSRFRIGGVNSVRGYSENSIPASGGLTMVQANFECRIPISGPFGIETFVDAGNVWERPVYVKGKNFVPRFSSAPSDRNDVRYVYGVGVRLNLPFGPLRVDAAWGTRPDERGVRPRHEIQFAIGPSF